MYSTVRPCLRFWSHQQHTALFLSAEDAKIRSQKFRRTCCVGTTTLVVVLLTVALVAILVSTSSSGDVERADVNVTLVTMTPEVLEVIAESDSGHVLEVKFTDDLDDLDEDGDVKSMQFMDEDDVINITTSSVAPCVYNMTVNGTLYQMALVTRNSTAGLQCPDVNITEEEDMSEGFELFLDFLLAPDGSLLPELSEGLYETYNVSGGDSDNAQNLHLMALARVELSDL